MKYFFTVIFLLLSACSSLEKNANTPEGAFAIAQEFDKDERFEEAIKRYNEVKNKFPYSNYAILSEIAVADVYYKQESFAEAQIAYQSFKDLHPKHAQIDYVVFRVGMSFFQQLPSSIDRDLSLAADAINEFNYLVQSFPGSTYVKEAEENRRKAQLMLAQKEEYIGDYYYIREFYESALPRYEKLYSTYKNLGFEPKALARASYCAAKIEKAEKSNQYKELLFSNYPQSKEAKNFAKEAP
jgi:outer membrane protein assembly factor BamD